jgi:signal transduction histidine kinase
MWKKQALDEAQVKRCLKAIEDSDDKALQDNMSEFDNQACHLEKMNEYRLTDKFLKMSDEQKQKFNWVMEWRIQAGIQTLNPSIPQAQNLADHAVQMSHMQSLKTANMAHEHLNPMGAEMAPPNQTQPVPNVTPLPQINRNRK